MRNREELHRSTRHDPSSHNSDAVRYGDLLFLSGQVGVDANGQVAGDVAAQAEAAFANLGRVLALAGAGPANVLKITIFMTNATDRGRILPARRAFFGAARPASTLVEVRGLARPEWLIEIEAVAAVPDQRGEG